MLDLCHAIYSVTGNTAVLHSCRSVKTRRIYASTILLNAPHFLLQAQHYLRYERESEARNKEKKERQHQMHASSNDTTSAKKTIHNAETRASSATNAQEHSKDARRTTTVAKPTQRGKKITKRCHIDK